MVRSTRRRVLYYAVTITLAVTGVVSSCAYMTGHLPIRPFNSTTWKNANDSHTRIQMVSLMLATHQLKGMTRQEIHQLLGPKTQNSYFDDDWVQYLGTERGMLRIDSEWLVIEFGADDRVTHWEIVTD